MSQTDIPTLEVLDEAEPPVQHNSDVNEFDGIDERAIKILKLSYGENWRQITTEHFKRVTTKNHLGIKL